MPYTPAHWKDKKKLSETINPRPNRSRAEEAHPWLQLVPRQPGAAPTARLRFTKSDGDGEMTGRRDEDKH